MAAGFIYFAHTLPGLVKVGRFSRHLTVADKERQYRTLVPGFTIHHAYPVDDDVVAEEARILAHLRLVAGTAVSGAGRENFQIPMEDAVQVATTSAADLEKQARTVIYGLKPGLDGLTVKELLDELNDKTASRKPSIRSIQRRGDIRDALRSLGIHAHSALPDDELDVDLYGLVIEPKLLLKVRPALKACATVLEGLTL